MGSCGVPDICAPSDGPVEVRPDIVGIGILVSFLLSAGAALFTVILGYLLDLLPGDYLSWADWGFLQTFHIRNCCRARYRGADDSTPTGNLKPCRHADQLVDEKRRKCLMAFLLTMSDQQLVTGPAMIIAALSQHCTITAYEFQVVNSLGWLASTTHLATLLVLRQYFQQNKVVRNIRVVAMLANLGLLLYTTILTSLSYAFDDNSVSIQCAVESPFIDVNNLFNLIAATSFLVLSYTETILELYGENHHPFRNWLRRYCCGRAGGPQLTEEQFELWYLRNVWLSEHRPGSEAQRSYAWRRAIAFHKPDERTSFPLQEFRRWWAVAADYRVAFLQEIPSLLLNATYALTQVITSRLNAPEVKDSENTVDFGQIVPLFLLALPILAVVEIVYEARSEHESSEKTSISHHQPAQTHSPDAATSATHPSPIELTTLTAPNVNPIWYTTTSTTRHSSHHLSTGLARFRTSPLSTALDPQLLYPYSHATHRHPLNLLFFALAALSIASGVLIFLVSSVSVALITMQILYFTFRTGEYIYFLSKLWIAVRRFDHFRHSNVNDSVLRYLEIPRGLKAPPSSPLLPGDDPADDGGLHQGRWADEPQPQVDDDEALADNFDERDVTDFDRIIHALPSPVRRRTTGFEVEDEGLEAGVGVERRPVRVNTVSEMV